MVNECFCHCVLYIIAVTSGSEGESDEAIGNVTCTKSAMPVTFTDYLAQISHNLDAHDGPRLAYLLRVTGPHVKDLLREFKNPTVSTNQSRDPLCLLRGERSGGP